MSANVIASLVIANHLEPLVCVHKRVKVEILLKRRGNPPPTTGDEEFPIVVSVINCSTNEIFENVEIMESIPEDQGDGIAPVQNGSINVSLSHEKLKCELYLRFSQSTISSINKDLKICVSPSALYASKIISTESSPFIVGEKYFYVETNMSEPYVFFKDIGGKDKAIQLSVSLRRSTTLHEESDPIEKPTSSILLRPVLRYASGQLVQDQTILKSINDANKFRISHEGTTTLRFRISEVSSKHRNERFVICLEQFVSPTAMALSSEDANAVATMATDIATGKSVPIDVRSKLNYNSVKRREAAAAGDMGSRMTATDVSHHNHYDSHSIATTTEEPVSKRSRLDPQDVAGHEYSQLLHYPKTSSLLLQAAASGTIPPLSSSSTILVENLKDLQLFLSDFSHEVDKLVMVHQFITYEGVSKQWFEDAKRRAEVVSTKLKYLPEYSGMLKNLQTTLEMVAMVPGQPTSSTLLPTPLGSSHSMSNNNSLNSQVHNNSNLFPNSLTNASHFLHDASKDNNISTFSGSLQSFHSRSSAGSSVLPISSGQQALSQATGMLAQPLGSVSSLPGDSTALHDNNNHRPKSALHHILSQRIAQPQSSLSLTSPTSLLNTALGDGSNSNNNSNNMGKRSQINVWDILSRYEG